MQERREKQRISSNFSAHVVNAGKNHFGRVKNISSGGFLFICQSKVVKGSEVQINLVIPEGSVFRLTGHIAWVGTEEEHAQAGHAHGIRLQNPQKTYKVYVEKMLPELHPGALEKAN